MALSVFVACNLFTKDSDKDIALVVATINVGVQRQVDGDKVFPAQKINIYKYDLYKEVNQNGQSLVDGGKSWQDAVEASLDNVIERELVYMDVAKQWAYGDIVWDKNKDGDTDYKNNNVVMKALYKAVDDRVFALINEILAERGETPIPAPDTNTPTPTFPVPPKEDDDNPPPETRWLPNSFPGDSNDSSMGDLSTASNFASLQREAFRRYIAEIESGIKDEFRASDTLKQKYQRQIDNIKNTIKGTDIVESYKNAYLQLGQDLYDAIQNGTNKIERGDDSVLWYSVARDPFRNQTLTLLQDKLKDSAKDGVTNARIYKYWSDTVTNQKKGI